MTTGYSGTPLARKLGIKEGTSVMVVDAPPDYLSWLDPLPAAVKFVKNIGPTIDLVHLFVSDRNTLQNQLTRWRASIRPDAAIWISWPKKASKVPTDITEDTIRDIALPLGFVDIKVCAVNEVWSGLKIVVRKELR